MGGGLCWGKQGHAHRLLVLLVVADSQEKVPQGLRVEGGGYDGEGGAGLHLVPPNHLLLVPAM
jgi:hypothetical protein